jgi:RNA polymerase sigma-70 factor (ECF subfamily)
MSDAEKSFTKRVTPNWFAAKLAEAQPLLYARICTLLGGIGDVWDVLQDANKVMLEKASEVRSPEGFMHWAYTVVRFEVMAYRKQASRQRRISDPSVLEKIAQQLSSQSLDFQDRLAALIECVKELPERQRQCVALRYDGDLPLSEVAAQLQQSENSVAAVLYRARLSLATCIKRKLGRGRAS